MPRTMIEYGLLLLVASGLLFSQYLLKVGVQQRGPLSLGSVGQVGGVIWQILTTPALLAGYAVSGATALVWVVILSRLQLSFAAPTMTAMYFILLLAISALVLGEAVSVWRWAGTLLIIAGIGLISKAA